jgi:hypothetical protein
MNWALLTAVSALTAALGSLPERTTMEASGYCMKNNTIINNAVTKIY